MKRQETPELCRDALPDRAVFARGAAEAAPLLLGKLLCHRTPAGLCAGMIVEAEAYCGAEDDAAHSFGGRRTARTEAMFGPPGRAYVFRIYGMHCCFNVVTAREGDPQAVLIRALEPVEGLALMAARRGTEDPLRLCSGPGKLCRALDIGMAQYGLDLCGSELYLAEYRDFSPAEICVSPRVNVDYAEVWRDAPLRFFLKDSPYVSKVPRRFGALGTLG
jgi:DNA-3-methyladenine glycosylase